MPDLGDPGMAFVIVQHLAPDHKSILTDLIRRYICMQVFEVEDGMAFAPNQAYTIPPGRGRGPHSPKRFEVGKLTIENLKMGQTSKIQEILMMKAAETVSSEHSASK